MSQTQIPAWAKGTPLETVLNFQGDFIDSEEKVKEGEEIIDELTHLEKILFTLFNLSVKAGQSLSETHQDCENHGPDNPECQKLRELYAETTMLKNSFWFFVEKRIGTLHKKDSLSIRSGFQIVKCIENNNYAENFAETIVDALMSVGAMGGKGLIGIKIGGK